MHIDFQMICLDIIVLVIIINTNYIPVVLHVIKNLHSLHNEIHLSILNSLIMVKNKSICMCLIAHTSVNSLLCSFSWWHMYRIFQLKQMSVSIKLVETSHLLLFLRIDEEFNVIPYIRQWRFSCFVNLWLLC